MCEEIKIKYSWNGSNDKFLDQVDVMEFDGFTIGRYGGATSVGAINNEDGIFLAMNNDSKWRFAAILDAHSTDESAILIIKTLEKQLPDIYEILHKGGLEVFEELKKCIISMFTSDDFRLKCDKIEGETACLICVQIKNFLWWFSVGDNTLLLLHPDLAGRGQYSLTQRNYYEWIGKASTFKSEIPCYATGIRELRQGDNYIYLITDGLLEFGERPYEDYSKLYSQLYTQDVNYGVSNVLNRVLKEKGKDSATIIGWKVSNDCKDTNPSL